MDGIIVVNKPKGCTSHDIVQRVKRITREKVGHTGTLDPNATGVLPVLIGKGTLLSKYLINHDKTYVVTLKLGEKTDTADIEGNIIVKKNVNKKLIEKSYIENVLKQFIGKQEQIPPMYSAIKVNGKKLYEYARKGEKIEVTARTIEIYDIKLLALKVENNEICFEVSCSKGTYIRSLCEDIAKKINTVGYMKDLNRTKVGCFNIDNSISIEIIEQNIKNINFLKEHFITIEDFFRDKKEIIISNKELKHFLNGVKIRRNLEDGIYKIYNETNIFIGTGSIQEKNLKRDIIIKDIENN